jgi:7-cyano-7-deazaguanine synthase
MKAYVLLSGGIDSSTCLYIAHEEFISVEGVSMNYGQRHSKEIEHAKLQCDRLGVKHSTISLAGLIPNTMLTDPKITVPNISYDEIKGVSPTYVPFRNGLMLAAITSFVHGELVRFGDSGSYDGLEWGIYFGAHAEDAQNWAYPDCTPEFIGAMANAISVGTYYNVRLHTPLEWMGKKDIIQWGSRLGVPWELTWSCYKGEDRQCGVCPTCRARRKGFLDAGIVDPTPYAEAM